MSRVYCALVHHPVLDKTGDEVTTSVTNLDVHDIARSARTYGLAGYFVVTPIEAQRPVVQKILDHWRIGAGKTRLPERGEALALVEVASSIEEAVARISAKEGIPPEVLVTSARKGPGRVGYPEVIRRLTEGQRPALILFGTGHGLSPEVVAGADLIIAPIEGPESYNHLSVRAAAAITFDRLFGRQSGIDDPI